MILFRSVRAYSELTDESIVDGHHAKSNPGRWHPMGCRAVYCSVAAAGTYAESGFWRLLEPLRLFKANPLPGMAEELKRLNGQEIRTAQVEVGIDPARIVDMSTADALHSWAKRAVVSITIRDALDPGAGRNYRITQRLALRVLEMGFCGIRVQSARAIGVENLVFYPDRFRVGESLRVLTHDGRNIFYSNAGSRWDGRDCSRILDTEIVVASSTVPGDTRISVRAR